MRLSSLRSEAPIRASGPRISIRSRDELILHSQVLMERPNRRLGHKKSRNGCNRCKARHVKCDEGRPCKNCVRHGMSCSLTDSPSPANTSRPLDHYAISQMEASDRFTPTAPSPRYSRIESPSTEHFSCDWLQSLRLMHHYSTSTCYVLPRDRSATELWLTAVPESACTHEFLMHGLLAISALHFAHVHPSMRHEYILISAHYQNVALRTFATRLNDIDQSNCEAYFFLASIIFTLSLCVVACHETVEKTIVPDDIAQSFMLLQGVKGILDFQPLEKWRLMGRPWDSMLNSSQIPEASIVNGSFQRRLDRITGLARDLPLSMDVINMQSACVLALESMRVTHSMSQNSAGGDSWNYMWTWPIALPTLCIDMISQGHPTALIILAHYAAFIRPYEQEDWVSAGWAAEVMAMIERNLDEEWQFWLKWPKRSITQRISVDKMDDYD